ncbi:hypothetical protein GCM10018954_062540 [Kutzneria kofuensis]
MAESTLVLTTANGTHRAGHTGPQCQPCLSHGGFGAARNPGEPEGPLGGPCADIPIRPSIGGRLEPSP